MAGATTSRGEHGGLAEGMIAAMRPPRTSGSGCSAAGAKLPHRVPDLALTPTERLAAWTEVYDRIVAVAAELRDHPPDIAAAARLAEAVAGIRQSLPAPRRREARQHRRLTDALALTGAELGLTATTGGRKTGTAAEALMEAGFAVANIVARYSHARSAAAPAPGA